MASSFLSPILLQTSAMSLHSLHSSSALPSLDKSSTNSLHASLSAFKLPFDLATALRIWAWRRRFELILGNGKWGKGPLGNSTATRGVTPSAGTQSTFVQAPAQVLGLDGLDQVDPDLSWGVVLSF